MRTWFVVLSAVAGIGLASQANAVTFNLSSNGTIETGTNPLTFLEDGIGLSVIGGRTGAADGGDILDFVPIETTLNRTNDGLAVDSDNADNNPAELDGIDPEFVQFTFSRRVRLENVVFAQVGNDDTVDFAVGNRDVDVIASSESSLSNPVLPLTDRLAFWSDATFTTNDTGVIFNGGGTGDAAGREFTFYTNGVDDDFTIFSITVVAAVPIPATLPLMIAALGGFGFVARRRMKAAQAA